jgi:glucosamine kinase
VYREILLLGVDGGGTNCRARLCDVSGAVLGEARAGAANMRFGLEDGLASVFEAASRCLADAGISQGESAQVAACLALAGASDPAITREIKRRELPFRVAVLTSDALAACVGAHGGRDGGIVIAGTGSIAEAVIAGRHIRIGGWGFPLSDEGSGAWIGSELLRRVLLAHDGRIEWTPLLDRAFGKFGGAHAIVHWMGTARPANFAALAPLAVEEAGRRDPVGCEIMEGAAAHIGDLVKSLAAQGVSRIALSGGLARSIEPWLAPDALCYLVPAAGDALTGAVELARKAVLPGGSP